MHWLADRDWLRSPGTITTRGKTSPLWEFNEQRRGDLEDAVRRHSAFRVEHGAELVIVPTGSLSSVATDLADPDSPLLWAMRTGDTQVPLIGVLDATLSDAARDALVDRLAPAGIRRIKILEVLPRPAAAAYGARLVENYPATGALRSPD